MAESPDDVCSGPSNDDPSDSLDSLATDARAISGVACADCTTDSKATFDDVLSLVEVPSDANGDATALPLFISRLFLLFVLTLFVICVFIRCTNPLRLEVHQLSIISKKSVRRNSNSNQMKSGLKRPFPN